MRPLSEQIPDDGLPLDRLLALGEALAARVARDHALDIARGDLHPDAILWDGADHVELPDPPRPRAVPDPIPDLTGQAALAAVGWFAPEQFAGAPPSVRGDSFVLGAILYLAATGAHPFADRRAREIADNIQGYHPPQPGRIRARLPTEWDGMITISLHKEPEMRLASALDLEREMEKLARHPLGGTPRTTRGRRLRTGRLLFTLLILAAIVVVLTRALSGATS